MKLRLGWVVLGPTCGSEVAAAVLELRRTVQVEPAELLLKIVLVWWQARQARQARQEGGLCVVRRWWHGGGAGRVVGALGTVRRLRGLRGVRGVRHCRTSHSARLLLLVVLLLLLLLLLDNHRLLLQCLELLLSLPEQSL